MFWRIRILLGAICIALFVTCQALAWLDIVADRYLDPCAGYGLDAEKISNLNFNGGDDFRDLVVTHQTNGGHVYVNRHTLFPPYFTLHPQSLAAGWQARFGNLRQGQPYKDLAVAEGIITTYFNNNTGTLQYNQTLTNGVNEWIAFGQLNLPPEIHIDLVGTDQQAIYDVNRFYNNGSGNLIPQIPPFVPSSDADQVELVDLDDYQQGTLPELIVATGYQIKIYNNNGAGSFNLTPRQVLNVDYPETPVMDFVVGDLNNDDFPDIVACTFYTLKSFFNDGNGMFYNANQLLPSQVFFEQIALTHFDADAYPDLALSYGNVLRIYPDDNQYNGYFSQLPIWEGVMESFPSYVVGHELIAADLTGTGTHSLICTGQQAYGRDRLLGI